MVDVPLNQVRLPSVFIPCRKVQDQCAKNLRHMVYVIQAVYILGPVSIGHACQVQTDQLGQESLP